MSPASARGPLEQQEPPDPDRLGPSPTQPSGFGRRREIGMAMGLHPEARPEQPLPHVDRPDDGPREPAVRWDDDPEPQPGPSRSGGDQCRAVDVAARDTVER